MISDELATLVSPGDPSDYTLARKLDMGDEAQFRWRSASGVSILAAVGIDRSVLKRSDDPAASITSTSKYGDADVTTLLSKSVGSTGF